MSGCVTLQVAPKTFLLASLPEDLNGNREKKRAENSENWWQHSGSHTVLLMLTSLQTGLPIEAFEDLFGWRYASMGCLRPAAGAELVALDLPLHPSPKSLTKAA